MLVPECCYSVLAQTRPSSTEPLHGFDANAALVRTLGRPPEDEDAAIGQEWSPRGGRRLQNAQEPTSPSLRETGGGRRWFQSSCLSRSPAGRAHRAGRSSRLPHGYSSASPSPRRNASLSRSPAKRGRGRRRRRRLRGGGGKGRGGRAEKRSSTSFEDSDETLSFDVISDDGSSGNSSFAHPFDASTRWPLDLSPAPPRVHGATSTPKPLGNLGGPFMRPESPYRTYRAKHSRLLRAQSSERAATLTRRSKFQEKLEKQWLPRSRSVDSARRRRGRRHGSSGMTSPLLQREGFGLLQSSITGKVLQGTEDPKTQCKLGFERTVSGGLYATSIAWSSRVSTPALSYRPPRSRQIFSCDIYNPMNPTSGRRKHPTIHFYAQVALGLQLPRDQSSPSGRDRAIAAATAEEAIRSAYEPMLISMSPEHRRRQNAVQCSTDWLRDHREESLTDGEEATDREGFSFSRRLSTRRRGRAGVSARGSAGGSSDGQSDTVRGVYRGREPFSVTRHFQQVGLRWPSPPEGAGGTAQFDNHRGLSASLGRSRGNRRHRHRMERLRGSKARGGCHSWSPPRTRTGTGPFGDGPIATAAGSSSSSKLFGLESREDEQGGRSYIYTGDGEYGHHRQRTASCLSDSSSCDGGAVYHHRPPLSPLMLPLDPYRRSRTVVRAGTVVSGRDAAAAEHSSRRAAFRLRRASEARASTEGRGTTLASSRGRDQPSRQQWRRWRRQSRGSDRSLSGDRNDGWTTSGTLLDVQEDERWRDRIRRCLPSVKGMDRELEAIRRADEAMREEQLAQV